MQQWQRDHQAKLWVWDIWAQWKRRRLVSRYFWIDSGFSALSPHCHPGCHRSALNQDHQFCWALGFCRFWGAKLWNSTDDRTTCTCTQGSLTITLTFGQWWSVNISMGIANNLICQKSLKRFKGQWKNQGPLCQIYWIDCRAWEQISNLPLSDIQYSLYWHASDLVPSFIVLLLVVCLRRICVFPLLQSEFK